jgi:hypothetical protein
MTLTKEVSAVLLRKLPLKLKDPRSFTIPCRIGDHSFERALLDLGAGVNLMPYNVYEMLGLRELQPSSITIQLVDRSIKRRRGICCINFNVLASTQIIYNIVCASTRSNLQGVVFAKTNSLSKLTIL